MNSGPHFEIRKDQSRGSLLGVVDEEQAVRSRQVPDEVWMAIVRGWLPWNVGGRLLPFLQFDY